MDLKVIDRTGLIREAYRIEEIGEPECRSIFLDWALKLPPDAPYETALRMLLAAYAEGAEDHPMTRVLRDGLVRAPAPTRRGGRRGRASSN